MCVSIAVLLKASALRVEFHLSRGGRGGGGGGGGGACKFLRLVMMVVMYKLLYYQALSEQTIQCMR